MFGVNTVISNANVWKVNIINEIANKYGFKIDWANTDIEKQQLNFLGEPDSIEDKIFDFFKELQEKLNIDVE